MNIKIIAGIIELQDCLKAKIISHFYLKKLIIKPRLFKIYFPLYDSIIKFRLGYSEKCFFKIKKREKNQLYFMAQVLLRVDVYQDQG